MIGGTITQGVWPFGKAKSEPKVRDMFMVLSPQNTHIIFPLRKNCLVQLYIPLDITHGEADRLCAFIKSIAFEDDLPKLEAP